MCKKLVVLVAMLCMGSVAFADVLVDDFESYWGPDVTDVWVPDIAYNSTAGNSATISLDIGGGVGGSQAGRTDATYVDGEYAGVKSGAIPQYTAVVGGALHFSIKLNEGQDWGKIQYMIVVQAGPGVNPDTKAGADGTNWAQTWILGDQVGYNGWMPISTVPATIGPSGTVSPTGGQAWQGLPRITPAMGWMDIVIPDTSIVSWSFSPKVSSFDTPVGTLAVEIWGAGNGGLPVQFSYELDNIWYQVPEPATIVLLGLGGLAMLRRKYSH